MPHPADVAEPRRRWAVIAAILALGKFDSATIIPAETALDSCGPVADGGDRTEIDRVQDPCVMGVFAWRNLLTRPLRTVLALIGLSIPILGVLGLFSVSGGLRNLVGDTLSQVEGVMVLRENAPSPVFSTLPAEPGRRPADDPRRPGRRPRGLGTRPADRGPGHDRRACSTQGKRTSIFDQPVIQGQDIAAHQNLQQRRLPQGPARAGRGAVPPARRRGASRTSSSAGRSPASTPTPQGQPRKVGDTLKIGGKPFTIVGIYETGSMLLDVVIVMDIDTARRLLDVAEDTVSSFYVEADDPTQNDDAGRRRSRRPIPGVDARSMSEFMANFGALMGQVDKFLLMTVSLALLVGVVGIINTMLMSTTERFVEFGVLRTNGWSQGNVLTLVTLESAYLGLLSGVVGCVLAVGRDGGRQPVHHGRRPPRRCPPGCSRWASACRSSPARSAASTPPGGPRGWCRWTRSGSGRIDDGDAMRRTDRRDMHIPPDHPLPMRSRFRTRLEARR